MTPCHDAFVLPYAAYLRVYEPLSAFSGADARHWSTYAVSAGRPRRAGALAAEHADALRRLISVPPVVAPERESGDAYVRRVDGATYICPWQTRLRSWLGLSRLRQRSLSCLGAPAANGYLLYSRTSLRPEPLLPDTLPEYDAAGQLHV